MGEERRYREEEIRAIFEAADPVERTTAPEGGLTLRSLQEIGREVGIPAERIAQALIGPKPVLLHLQEPVG